MVKSTIDEKVLETHVNYDEWEREQYIVDLETGETIVIQVKDSQGTLLQEKSFTAKFINCHVNVQWQDKGAKEE